MTVDIELFGGPHDGLCLCVDDPPDGQALFAVRVLTLVRT